MVDIKISRWWLLVFGLVAIDQLTKYFARLNQLTVINPGVSFGFLAKFEMVPGLIVGCLILILALVWSQKPNWPLSLLFAGGLSNWLDRLSAGGVVDWLTIPMTSYRNNLADYLIAVGVVWWLWITIRRSPNCQRPLANGFERNTHD